MPNLDLPIMVVDDAKFSSTIIGKTLKQAGYRDVRIANDAPSAIEMIEKRHVNVLIADWLMPGMDGLELTARVRQLDEQNNHFTYIILLTAKEGTTALTEAFDKGVDDFIFKSEMNKQLLPRVFAADRLADIQNAMLTANQLLIENNRDLENKNIVDMETGLGNRKYAMDQLQQSLQHTESRGGATSFMMLGIKNWQELKQQNNPILMEEIAVGVARRLRHLVRPLDSICRIAEDRFAIVAHFNSVENCTAHCYRRIHDGVNLRAFKTTAGYISVNAGSCAVAIGNKDKLPGAEDVSQLGDKIIHEAYETGTIVVREWRNARMSA